MNAITRAHNFLQKNPDVYGWRKFQVGPNYTIEYRSEIRMGEWEIQSSEGAHIGLHKYLDNAIEAVLLLDEAVILPQDVSCIRED